MSIYRFARCARDLTRRIIEGTIEKEQKRRDRRMTARRDGRWRSAGRAQIDRSEIIAPDRSATTSLSATCDDSDMSNATGNEVSHGSSRSPTRRASADDSAPAGGYFNRSKQSLVTTIHQKVRRASPSSRRNVLSASCYRARRSSSVRSSSSPRVDLSRANSGIVVCVC